MQKSFTNKKSEKYKCKVGILMIYKPTHGQQASEKSLVLTPIIEFLLSLKMFDDKSAPLIIYNIIILHQTTKMEYSYYEALIQHTSQLFDLELANIIQFYRLPPPISFEEYLHTKSIIQRVEECHSEQESTQQNISFDLSRHKALDSSLPSKTRQIIKDRHRIYMLHESSDSEDETPVRRQNRHKKRRGEKEDGYPTKNFLPNFKGPHITFLEKELGFDYVNQFEIIQIIKGKNGISMKDYETLYKVQQFQEAFKLFFRTRVLYRELMLSRSSMRARKIHMKKLSVFEKAFNEKVFDRIN